MVAVKVTFELSLVGLLELLLSAAVLKLFQIENPEDAIGKRVTFRVLVQQNGSDEVEEIELTKY